MELLLSVIIGSMIIGAIYALHARDLLSALISCGIVGYSLVICFLLLKAPDLAIVQIVVETITLVIMVAVVLDSARHELKEKKMIQYKAVSFINIRFLISLMAFIVCAGIFFYFFYEAIEPLSIFGEHTTRMATTYIETGASDTGSANMVTGILFDYRGYDTFGEATILFTAVIGVMTILRLRGKKG